MAVTAGRRTRRRRACARRGRRRRRAADRGARCGRRDRRRGATRAGADWRGRCDRGRARRRATRRPGSRAPAASIRRSGAGAAASGRCRRVEDDGPAERGELDERDRELAAGRRRLADDHAACRRACRRRAPSRRPRASMRERARAPCASLVRSRSTGQPAGSLGSVVAERLELDRVAGAARELDRGRRRGRDGLARDLARRRRRAGPWSRDRRCRRCSLPSLRELAVEPLAIDRELGGRVGRCGTEADGDALGGAAEQLDGRGGGAGAVERGRRRPRARRAGRPGRARPVARAGGVSSAGS